MRTVASSENAVLVTLAVPLLTVVDVMLTSTFILISVPLAWKNWKWHTGGNRKEEAKLTRSTHQT